MANTDIRQFYFYFKYLWAPADFENMQDWLQSEFRGISEGAFGASILSGCKVTPGGGMTVDVEAGLCVNEDGRLLVVEADNLTVASPSGNPAKTLIVARPVDTDTEDIPEPVAPSNSVPLHKKLTYELVVLNGTPAASPSYPSVQAGDVILMGLSLNSGHTTIVNANLERSKISLPRKRVHPYRLELGSYSAIAADEHIDVDGSASGGTVLLPSAQEVPGQDYTILKSDSSANVVAVSGQGGDLISGESSWELTDQWQKLTVRSIGTAWRIV